MPPVQPIQSNDQARLKVLIDYLTSPKAKKELEIVPEPEKPNPIGGNALTRTIFRIFPFIRPEVAAPHIQPQVPPPEPASEENLSVTEAARELATIFAGKDNTTFNHLSSLGQFKQWKILRAAMLAVIYGRGIPEDERVKFRAALMRYTQHDDVPVFSKEDKFGALVTFEEVLKVLDMSFNLGMNFSHFQFATQILSNARSMLEEFLRHVNRATDYATYLGKRCPGTRDDFPGPGIVIKGLGAGVPVFPKDYIKELLPKVNTAIQVNQHSVNSVLPSEEVENRYRELMISSEKDFPFTQIGFFRGVIVVRNPQRMLIDNKSFALVVYNDHFQNEEQEVSFLIPDKIAADFLANPYHGLNGQNLLFPTNTIARSDVVMNLTQATVLGGMDKAIPIGGTHFYEGSKFYDMWRREHLRDLRVPERNYSRETADVNKRIHRTHMFAGDTNPLSGGGVHTNYWKDRFDMRNLIPYKLAHDEVTKCTLFGFAQLALLNEAFRLYNYGHEYSLRERKWTYDPFRLLRYAIDFRKSRRFKDGQKPVLVGVEPGRYSHFSGGLLKTVGVVDITHMLWHKEARSAGSKTGVDTKLLPGEFPQGDVDLTSRRVWEKHDGGGETKNWLDFSECAYNNGAEPVFYYYHILPQLMEAIKRKQGESK